MDQTVCPTTTTTTNFAYFLFRLAMLHYGFDSNVTKLLANLLPSHLYFIILQIVMCNLVLIKNIIIITPYLGLPCTLLPLTSTINIFLAIVLTLLASALYIPAFYARLHS